MEVFYALKSPRGKIHKLETPYSQKYTASDAKGIAAAFKNGDPNAFAVYQQLTREPLFHYEGKKKVYEYRMKDGEILKEAKHGKLVPIKRYKYKLTGKRIRSKQRTVIYGVSGYVAPTGIGFSKKSAQESSSGKFTMLPVAGVGRGKKGPVEVTLSGATIKETIKNLKPTVGTKAMVRLGISALHYDADLIITRPKIPFRAGTAAFRARENWIHSVWGADKEIVISVNSTVDRLVNFSDALSVRIREALSIKGLRVTSLVNLVAAERRAELKNEIGIDRIIHRPTTEHRTHATDFKPLRVESKGKQVYNNKSPYNAGITLKITVTALKAIES